MRQIELPSRILVLSLSTAVIWWVSLGLLALLTANPVTLNDMQVRQAQYVVTASVEDLASSTLRVEKEWKHGAELERIQLENLQRFDVVEGSAYVFPLNRREGDRFSVVTTLKRTASRKKQILPYDGVVVDGLATVIERSQDTGLLEVVRKRHGDEVRAGSQLKQGRLTVESEMRGLCVYPANEAASQQLQSILDDFPRKER